MDLFERRSDLHADRGLLTSGRFEAEGWSTAPDDDAANIWGFELATQGRA